MQDTKAKLAGFNQSGKVLYVSVAREAKIVLVREACQNGWETNDGRFAADAHVTLALFSSCV